MHASVVIGFLAVAAPFVADAAACAGAYEACGGNSWSPTCCVSGYKCVKASDYYSQCLPDNSPSTAPPTTTTAPATTTPTPTGTGTTPAPTTASPTPKPTTSGSAYLTYDTSAPIAAHSQAAYPKADASACGATSWALVDNVCCPTYCSNSNTSEFCTGCTGSCISPPSAECKSGTMWGEQTTVTSDEKWHYSRSTHYGITAAGACGFGLYAMCTKGSKTASWTDKWLGDSCDAFCKAYPDLCKDPSDLTLRGNFAAPNGDYYSQFWSHLAGERDNYLSCGECFEVVRTKPDGTDYAIGEAGYTEPVILEITDSCPCDANSKWCCGSGDDHCGEINFKYGCPLPKDSHHLDLSDVAMGRLQGNGSVSSGVIPTRYKRVACPKPGNIYIWVKNAGQYFFALSVVNTAGVGSVTKFEMKGAGMTDWVSLVHDPNYTPARPQERFGGWAIPQGSGPFNPPISMRVTSPNGEQVVSENVMKSFNPPASAPSGFWYLDLGAQFTMDGKH